MLIQTVSVMWLVASLAAPHPPQAKTYKAAKARRHFISITFEKQFIQPYSFANHPLADLFGQPVDEVHLQSFQYRTRDQQTLVNVLEYGKRATGIGATVYPLGSSVGATLAVRGSIESVPTIRAGVHRAGAGADLRTDQRTRHRPRRRARDVAIDPRDGASAAHAFILGGIGWLETDQMNGNRYFGRRRRRRDVGAVRRRPRRSSSR